MEKKELFEVLCMQGHLTNDQETSHEDLDNGEWLCPVKGCGATAYSWDEEGEDDN